MSVQDAAARSASDRRVVLISQSEVIELLTLEDCIAAVEKAFRLRAEGKALKTALLHVDTSNGEFHVKAGGLTLDRTYFGLKSNGGFFENPGRFGLPAIQGMIVLADGENGLPLAIMDSVAITRMRTGAATAVAAKYLARPDSKVVTVCGNGTQARVQLLALRHVLPLEQVFVFGRNISKVAEFCDLMCEELQREVIPATSLAAAAAKSDAIVTCTPSKVPYLMKEFVRPGTFVAAVGADSPDKQELDPALFADSKIVVDVLEQCEKVGELHQAIRDGFIGRERVHAELGDIAAGNKPGRSTDDEVTIFDSTGTALQDVAAAAIVYKRATEEGNPTKFGLHE